MARLWNVSEYQKNQLLPSFSTEISVISLLRLMHYTDD